MKSENGEQEEGETPEWIVAKKRASRKDLAVFVILTKSEIFLLKNFKRTIECFCIIAQLSHFHFIYGSRLRFIFAKF